MKARRSLFVVSLLLISVLLMAFAPLPQSEEPGLTDAQLVIIGLVASLATWVLNVLVSQGYNPRREHVAVALYVVSFFAAIAFTPVTFPSFPPFSDAPTFIGAVLAYAGTLLALAAPVVGMAYLIYNLLLKRVLEQAFPAAAAKVR